MIKIPVTSREQWLEERRRSLGGSDVGAVLGLNPYRSPFSVWAEKTGRLPPAEDNEAMRQGRDLEGYVAQRFEERSGKRVQKLNYILRNEAAPYLHASIDRRIVGERAGLECKTASALSTRAYMGGEFPESYYAQCVAYLAVTGWERWYLAALVLNKAFYIYQITTLEDDPCPRWCESSVYVCAGELDALKGCAKEFWEAYVLPGTPPPADGSPATSRALDAMYPHSGEETVQLFGREAILEEYIRLAGEKKGLERRMEQIRQTIMGDMMDAGSAVCGTYSISWRGQERKTFDAGMFAKDYPEVDLGPYYKKTAVRPFRIKEEV